jgi:hypothetical protein
VTACGILLWRRQHSSLAGHLAIAILLVAVSAPRLAEIFPPVITNASPGVVFDVTFDCNQRFSIGDGLEVNIEGQASGSIGLNWHALEEDCKSLRLSVPVVETVSTGPRSLPQGYRISTSGADRHGRRAQDRSGSVVGVPDLSGVRTIFEPFEFVQPATFVCAVAQTMVRAYDDLEKAWRTGRGTNQAYHVTGPRVPQPAYTARALRPD